MNDDHLPAAVLWDMDGTLVNSEPYWMEAETALARRYGATWTTEQALQMVGNDLLVSARIFREQTGVTLTPEEIVAELQGRVLHQVRSSGAPWRPGALELLGSLQAAGVPCALVTMSYAQFAHAVVGAAPPGSFSTVVAGDEVTRGKPDPEPYVTAAAKLDVDITRCVAIEDSAPGVASALASGARTIAVPMMIDIPARGGLSRAASLEDVDLAFLSRVRAGFDVDTITTPVLS